MEVYLWTSKWPWNSAVVASQAVKYTRAKLLVINCLVTFSQNPPAQGQRWFVFGAKRNVVPQLNLSARVLKTWEFSGFCGSFSRFLTSIEGLQSNSEAWDRSARLQLRQRLLVFIVTEKFYDHIFLFMFSGPGWHSFLFYCLLVLFSVASLHPLHFISRTYAAPHTHMCTGQSSEDGKGWAELPGCIRLEIWIVAISWMESLQGQHDIF